MIDIVDGTKAMTRKDLVELIEQQTGMLDQADAALNDLRTELSEAKAEIERLKGQYNDLLYQVSIKYPGESRHDTAKRYIQHAERVSDDASCEKEQE